MMKTKKYLRLLLVFLVLSSCTYDFPETVQNTKIDLGDISVEKLISVGDDYVAGVMDGALYSDGQKNSVAAIIASQLNKLEKFNFVQPDINSENGFNIYMSTQNEFFGKWVYQFQYQTDEFPKLILTQGEQVQDYPGDKNVLNNLAVPQLSTGQLSNPGLADNPFFVRVSQNYNTSLIDQVVQKSPSFVICFIGMNDFLPFAMNGAKEGETLTSIGDFQTNLNLFIDKLIQNTQSKIVIGNLISIKDLPFFYTNQYNFIRLTNLKKGAAQAVYSNFNNAVAKHNVGIPQDQKRPFIGFEDNGATLYPQPVVVIDENLPEASYPDGTPLEKFRQLTEGEMALFSITPEMVEKGLGSVVPLTEEFYLSENQINLIEKRTTAFNELIKNAVQQYPERIAVAEINNAVHNIAETGKIDGWGTHVSDETFYVEGVPLEGNLNQNSIFSLDAVHLNQRGNAFLANVFIEAINTGFNANIPFSEINNYIGNIYKSLF